MIPPLTDSDPEWHTDLRKAAEMALPLLVAYQDYTGDSRIANKCGEAIEALRQALAQPDWTTDTPVPPFKYLDFAEYKGTGEDVKIKHSLAQPEQEPVAWITRRTGDGGVVISGYETCEPTDYDAIPVYTAPTKREWQALAQPEQNKYEVIAGQFVFIDGAAKNPFQREWVSLTDADIASLENIHETHGLDVRNIAQIINSLLRDRNK